MTGFLKSSQKRDENASRSCSVHLDTVFQTHPADSQASIKLLKVMSIQELFISPWANTLFTKLVFWSVIGEQWFVMPMWYHMWDIFTHWLRFCLPFFNQLWRVILYCRSCSYGLILGIVLCIYIITLQFLQRTTLVCVCCLLVDPMSSRHNGTVTSPSLQSSSCRLLQSTVCVLNKCEI